MRRGTTLLAVACLAALMLAVASAQAATSCQQMRSWVRSGGSASGLLVVDTESGQTICANAPGRPRVLASNTKLFTTAAALSQLGPETRLPTRVFADGSLNPNGVLRGSLYLKGGGDPTLGTPAFTSSYLAGQGTNHLALTPQIRAAGIRSITGRVYADATIFDNVRGVADSGYATSPYIGPLSGLSFNAGFNGSTSGSGFSSDPAKLAAAKLARSLGRAGIRVPSQVALATTPPNADEVAVIRSPTLDQIVNVTDVYSNNFFAETLVKLLGAQLGTAGTTAAGTAVVEQFARSRGSGINAVDGSGLTRSNRASPRQVVDLLLAMRDDPAGDNFIQDLALSGKEGTVDDRMGGRAYGRCRVKTGTLTGVSALSGYCFNTSGRIMAFSILMNGVSSTSTAHYYQDRIASAVAGY